MWRDGMGWDWKGGVCCCCGSNFCCGRMTAAYYTVSTQRGVAKTDMTRLFILSCFLSASLCGQSMLFAWLLEAAGSEAL